MTAKLLMNPNPVALRTTDRIADGARQILLKQRRGLPVVDGDGRFQGMLTANCLLYLCLPRAATMAKGLENMPYVTNTLRDVAERLTRYLDEPVSLCLKVENVAIVHPETPLVETLLILYQSKANLPVVEEGTDRLVGMISYFDVGTKIMEEISEQTG